MSEIKNKSKNANSNLMKNFYLFGVDPEDIKISDSDLEKYCLMKDSIQIKLLSKFPPTETKSLIDSNIILSHCFPNGYSLKQSKSDIPLENEFFHFSLKNLLGTSYNDKKINFTCCIFYENLNQYIFLKNIKKNASQL